MKMSTITIYAETPCLVVISGFIPKRNQNGGVGGFRYLESIFLDSRYYNNPISKNKELGQRCSKLLASTEPVNSRAGSKIEV